MFKGFFGIKNINERLIREYDSFKELQSKKLFESSYEYIEPTYFWNSEIKKGKLIENIFLQIENDGAQLIILEAANCDWTISSLFTQIAYHHYKAREWIPMLKNVFKMRILDYEDLEEILLYFDENSLVAKQFFRIDREEFLIKLSDMKVPCPLKMKNLIFLANLFQIHDPRIDKLTPSPLKEIM